ncbi:peptide MFS transporter [Janibacter cremeus]|uniref:POT family proton-dependent oligopeptide transporter n=1 Tax=Janibacter cremeus TaxID=1285192 RepID=A0A852VY15_9MICO|nr:peptide MFS transporter [Janibacter cremeus]NYF98645.1 POT family proton-dependent oligopeptide transporter [Janibacter cremeus]
MSSSPDVDTREEDRSFLGQPRMLANLFSVELWERFSFYGMQGILLYYMYFSVADGGLGIDQAVATGLVGAYGGAVYLSTILGAWLADRVLGSERVLFYSAIMIMCGHISLAVLPGAVGLAVGLVLVAVGSGGLKATATALVGTLYAEGDERRDAGFSIFYMGINIGGLLGPLITGWLQTSWGFHFGFAAAAVGMAIGLVQYSLTRKNLPAESHDVPNPLPSSERGKWLGIGAAALVVIVVLLVTGLVNASNLATVVAGAAIIAAIGYFVLLLTNSRVNAVERRRVAAFIPLFIASAAFWALFQQQFTVVAIYSEQRLDRTIFGWTMPPSFVQSINPVFIIVFAAVFAAMWTKLGPRQPSSPLKFAIGLVLMGIAFLLFIPFSTDTPNSAPLYGIVIVLLFFTWAELSLSPVGLSVATKLAPAAFRAQMVALFFLSVSLGTTLAGVLAGYYDPNDEVGYFTFSGVTAIVLGLALAGATPSIKKLMSGVR